jgi:hypothetical protein
MARVEFADAERYSAVALQINLDSANRLEAPIAGATGTLAYATPITTKRFVRVSDKVAALIFAQLRAVESSPVMPFCHSFSARRALS